MPQPEPTRSGLAELQETWDLWTEESVRQRLLERALAPQRFRQECEPHMAEAPYPPHVSLWVEERDRLAFVGVFRVMHDTPHRGIMTLEADFVDLELVRHIQRLPIRLSRCLDPQHPDATYDGRVEHQADLMDIEGRNVQPQMYREVFVIAECKAEEQCQGPYRVDLFEGAYRRLVTVRLGLRPRDHYVRDLPEGPWSYSQRPL